MIDLKTFVQLVDGRAHKQCGLGFVLSKIEVKIKQHKH